ncbi:TetR/AcrR family transcriptional regulator [Actinoplanes sp. NEAU-A12]|uniref:TetR/AcrR family transcriptional regulator n=1 Tax=Actinoplanes sandaracinus TaxID=3045177 RepID=A0ABT6WGZ1_9ACTN|nr:TetR/AcrR family transcriptional regulator [Actinoplanes sandaracinus]MDI6099000.1 TetR/AcrR family transcriptional regulator [Actinoplanes sandaracinus]
MSTADRPGLTDRLVDEAARILVESGPAGLSLRRLATACGVSTMPVYTLFGDKQGLLAAMHREGFRRLGAALEQVAVTGDPLADLTALGAAYRAAALASPHLYALMFGHMAPDFSPGEQGRAAADATYQPLVDAVARCQRAGVLRGDDPQRIALHLWAVAHGMVNLELNRQLPPLGDPADLFREALGYAGAPFLTAPA